MCLSGCSAKAPAPETMEIFAMNTAMSFAVYGEEATETILASVKRINELERLLSRTVEKSEIGYLNRGVSVQLSEETEMLLRRAIDFTEKTGGAFDVTVAPIVEAWGIHTESPRVVPQEELDALLPLVGTEHIHLTDIGYDSLDEGCAIDLGGIAKGYASDCVAAIFRERGIESGWANLGGNVYVHGVKPDGEPWAVAIRDPAGGEAAAAMLHLSDSFVITSGGYQRYYVAPDGQVYQHIIDPATGRPAQSDLLSVTIVAKEGTMADAYSTALYVLGEAGAIDLWRANRGEFDMVLITADRRLLYTPGLAGKLETEEGGAYAVQALT